MKITKAEDYAITFISALGDGANNNFVPLTKIAFSHRLPMPFLKKVAKKLSNQGLVEVREGRSGGYRLTRSFERITVGEILKAFNPRPITSVCMMGKHRNSCPAYSRCFSRHAWQTIINKFYDEVNTLTLKELK